MTSRSYSLWDKASRRRGFIDSEGADAVIFSEGIFVFNIEDDNGMIHAINWHSLYIPTTLLALSFHRSIGIKQTY